MSKRTAERKRVRGMWLWRVLRVALMSYVGLAALMWLMQSRLVFAPSQRIEATPTEAGLAYEDVRLRTADGLNLHAWFVPAPRPLGTVLFCHGNAGNLSHCLEAIAQYHRLGFSSLVFDYRGYGRSEGRPTERGAYRDAEAAWRYLTETRGIAPDDIIVHGRSLGGAVAAHLAAERAPRALVVESAFTSVPDLGQEMYPWLPVRLLSRFRYDTREYLQRVACPVLIAHSPEDETVPYHHGRRLFEAAREPKRWLEMRGGHNDGYLVSGRGYEAALKAFMANPPETKEAPQ